MLVNMIENNIQVCDQVLSTNNYEIFKRVDGNRGLNQRNFNKLINSMKEEQLKIPIIVNEKYEIIDGQHRFEAAKFLGLPIYFIIIKGYGLSQVKRANIVSSNWTKKDFLEMFITEGKEIYSEFKNICDRYDISIGILIKLFAKVQEKQSIKVSHDFEDGNLVLDGKEKVIEFLDALEKFNNFKHYKDTQFVTAFMRLYFRTEYSQNKMEGRIKKHFAILEKCNTVDEYLELLCNRLYSYGRTEKPIYYSSSSKKFHQ